MILNGQLKKSVEVFTCLLTSDILGSINKQQQQRQRKRGNNMSSVNECAIVGMETYQKLLSVLSPETVLCVRGRHAIGKSEGVYQAAARRRADVYKNPEFCARMVEAISDPSYKAVRHATGWKTEWNYDMGVPVVERRLSQMTEGDMIGLPRECQVDGQDCTQFRACDWIIQACHFPVVLFLDERNRALDGVKQSVFQIADSKAFYGNRLNVETMVVVAENVGDEYQVQQNDPAETSRWVTVQLEPSAEEFFDYIKSRVNPAILEFLRSSPKSLEYIGAFEPNKKYPDRRSWYKFALEADKLNLLDDDEPQNLLRILANGYLGMETGPAFFQYMKDRERQVRAEDVLTNWKKTKKRLMVNNRLTNEKYVEIVSKLGDYFKGGNSNQPKVIDDHQADQLAAFMWSCPAEPLLAAWSMLQDNTENLLRVHPLVNELLIRAASGGDVDEVRPERYQDDDDMLEALTSAEPAKKSRGRRKTAK